MLAQETKDILAVAGRHVRSFVSRRPTTTRAAMPDHYLAKSLAARRGAFFV
jgi:hypothetical protein